MRTRILLPLLATLALLPLPSRASLTTDLQALVRRVAGLETQLAAIDPTAPGACAELGTLNTSIEDYNASVADLTARLPSPLTLATTDLTSLASLSAASLRMAGAAAERSAQLRTVEGLQALFEYRSTRSAMLRLSQDIGAMADRILEMAERILVMSDDIGGMADRILATQELQNQNVALTTRSILTTQSNALAVVSVVEDASYAFSIAALISEGEELASRMQAVVLKPWTMATELERVASDVRAFLAQVKGLQDSVAAGASASTFTVTPAGLTQLTNLSAMLAGLSTAVDGYVVAIGGLAAITSSPTLEDALRSMLQLSADIGVMANRILEMSDQILAMSDNIGMQADLILATQAATSADVAAVQGSILAAQSFAVSLFASRWL